MVARLPIHRATLGISILLAAGLMALQSDPVQAGEKGFGAKVLQSEDVGELGGERKMQMVMFTVQPGATVPEHKHAGPGLRYVLDGAITIAWKDGEEKTYEAGETYFEGPGANHPAGDISARNPTDEVTRVLIIETLPK